MRASLATFRAAVAEVRANRASFWTQVVVMVANDLCWVLFWSLFFGRVGAVRGWDVGRVLVLEASLCTAGGSALGVFGNARRIGTLAAEGGLDAVLSLPVSPLAHTLMRRVDPSNLGDIAFGLTLFAVVGSPTAGRTAVFVAGALAATVVFVGFLVTTGSLAFFVGRGEPGDLGLHALLMLAAYPTDIFTGVPRLVVHGVIPAAFVATVPASLVGTPDTGLAIALGAAAVITATLAWATFNLGLRRYTSGSVWTRA
jgi:ABC-2 type transport system permease protein